MVSPKGLVTDATHLLIRDRLRDALGVGRDGWAALASRLGTPGDGAPAPTEDRGGVANPDVDRYTQHDSEPPLIQVHPDLVRF